MQKSLEDFVAKTKEMDESSLDVEEVAKKFGQIVLRTADALLMRELELLLRKLCNKIPELRGSNKSALLYRVRQRNIAQGEDSALDAIMFSPLKQEQEAFEDFCKEQSRSMSK